MSADLSVEMIEMLEFVLIMYCLGMLTFSFFILDSESGVSVFALAGIILGVTHAALPMDELNSFICKGFFFLFYNIYLLFI